MRLAPSLLLAILAAAALPALAAAPAEPSVLRVEASGFQREGALAMHAVAVDEAAARAAIGPGRVLSLPHPEGGTLAYRYLRHVEHGEGRFTWIGRSVAEPMVGREAVLSFGGGVGVGPLPVDGGGTLRLALEDGRNVLIVDEAEALGGSSLWGADGQRPAGVVAEATQDDAIEAELAALDAGLAAGMDDILAAPPAPGADPGTLADTAAFVEVLLLFTSELAAQAGSDSAAVTLMQNRLELANTALANSGVIHRFRAVGSQRVPFDDSSATALSNGIASIRLAGLQTPNWPIPFARRVLQLRYRFGADVVVIGRAASARSSTCASSFRISFSGDWSRQHNDGHVLFSEGQVNGVLCPEISLANGLGFAMGQNDFQSFRSGIAHSYARGWSADPDGTGGARGFYTLMAPIDADRDRALLFSTPLLSLPACKSSPCGSAAENDSARSLAQTMPLAAGWVASTSDRVFDIQGTRGHVDLPPITPTAAATITQWRAVARQGVLTVTGPALLVANQPYVLRVAYDRLTLHDGPMQVVVEGVDSGGLVRVTSVWQFRRPTTRTDIHASERYLFMEKAHPLLVRQGGANEAESRLFFDVPPNAVNVFVAVTATGQAVEAHLRPAEANDGPTSALLPSTLGATGATLSDTGTGLTKVLTLNSSNGLVPGRWNLVLVAPGAIGEAPVPVSVRVSYQYTVPSAIPANAGQYFNPNRDGHGVFIDRAGSQWIGVWYAYRENGSPTFYYLQGAAPTITAPQYTGLVYRVSFNGTAATVAEIGDISFTPTSATTMTMSYNIDGESGSEPVVRLGGGGCPVFSGAPLAGTAHWFSPSLSGFGYSAQYEPTQEIYAAYLYDNQGRPTWQLAQGTFETSTNVLGLALRQYTGSCPLCGHRPTTSTIAGTLTRTFGINADGQRGLVNMRVNSTLRSPLVGTWLQDRPTALLSARLPCP